MRTYFVLIGLILCIQAQAQQPQLESHEAWVDLTTAPPELVVSGVNFDNGAVLDVFFGNVPLTPVTLTVDSVLGVTELRAPLPVGFDPDNDAGTYTVFITSGGGSIRYDEIHVTVGSTGPHGPEGPAGPKGDPGNPGATGPKGDTGEKGAPGQDGDDCAVAQLGTAEQPLGATVKCGATVATIPKGDKGDKGDTGAEGAPGGQGPAGTNGLACWDLDGDGVGNVATEDFNGDGIVDVNDCKGDQVVNLTVEIPDVPGLVAQDFVTIFPDAAKNTVLIELGGICFGEGVVVNGPGFEIEVIPGFRQDGLPDNQSGLSTELPLVLEFVDDPAVLSDCATAISEWLANPALFGSQSMSIITKDPSGAEQVRWNIYGLFPTSEQPGFDGRTRFVLEVSDEFSPATGAPMPNPNNTVSIDRESALCCGSGAIFPTDPSVNLATDKAVELEGVSFVYPAVEVEDPSAARLVLVYDAVEAGPVFLFAKDIATSGTTNTSKRSISIYSVDQNVSELPGTRTNYFGCIAVRWEQFTGFRQFASLKERVTLQCDFSQPGF